MTPSNQTILVTGATGNQGGAVARHLLQRGAFKVRAFVRDPNKPAAQTLKQAGAELVQGDFSDRASLDQALQGVSGVFSVQIFKNGAQAELRDAKAVADASKAAGIEHFVYSSVASAERNTGVPIFDTKFQVEEYVRSLNLPYTILRPVFFLYNYNALRPIIEGGMLTRPLSPDRKLQQLSEEDYGAVVAQVFERSADFFSGAEEVASVNMTMTEIAESFSRVLGKSVKYQQISFDEFEQQAGKNATIMYRWFENVGHAADFAELHRDFGKLSDFDSYLRDRGWAKPAASTSGSESKG